VLRFRASLNEHEAELSLAVGKSVSTPAGCPLLEPHSIVFEEDIQRFSREQILAVYDEESGEGTTRQR
jgi:hypothetical protein